MSKIPDQFKVTDEKPLQTSARLDAHFEALKGALDRAGLACKKMSSPDVAADPLHKYDTAQALSHMVMQTIAARIRQTGHDGFVVLVCYPEDGVKLDMSDPLNEVTFDELMGIKGPRSGKVGSAEAPDAKA